MGEGSLRPKLYEYHKRLCIARDRNDAAGVFGLSKHHASDISLIAVEYPEYWAGYERE